MKYCSDCGDKVVLKLVDGDAIMRYVCESCNTIHYTNPKVVTGALIRWQNKVLLSRRAIEPRYGYWNIPAGYLENGETTQDGAMREAMEEAGATIEIEGVHTIYNIPQVNQVYIHFLAKLKYENAYSNGPESIETQLFSEEEIPWDKLAFKSSYFALKRYFEDLKIKNYKTHIGTHPQEQ